MKKLIIFVAIIEMTGWNMSVKAQEQDLSGFGISTMFGGSFCVKNGSAKCTNTDPSFGLSVSPGYRISNNIGLGLDFVYGMYDTSGYNASVIGLTVGPILYLPLDKLDLFVGLGLGWMRLHLEVNGSSGNADGFGLSLRAGFEYRVVKNLGMGIMFRFNFNFAEQVCAEGHCADIDDVAHNAIVGGRISIYF